MPDTERAVIRAAATVAPEPWWRSAVIYQVYIRSFADGNGDGMGDIAGLRSRLDYLADLGVDAIWINPWYPSPMKDAGYDVSDYRAVEPVFGRLDEADELIGAAHDRGLRVLLDIVPNHTSDQHPWFQRALNAPAGSPERDAPCGSGSTAGWTASGSTSRTRWPKPMPCGSASAWSKICPTRFSTTRSSNSPDGPAAVGTAAGCRCRGPAIDRRSGSVRRE